MIEFAEPRIIRPATESDLEPLQKYLPKGDATLHTKRYEQQKNGDAVYLLAVQGSIPVGHALLKWKGATDEPITANLSEPAPDVEDLFVHEEHRNRKVASRLLGKAELLARDRGYKQIGLSCGADNTLARALYDQRGYLDSGIAPYTLSGKYTDANGAEQEWNERDCTYFLLPLTVPVGEAASETNMENNNITPSEETSQGDLSVQGSPEQSTAPESVEPTKSPEKPLSEQVVDFAFGVALTAAEALEKAVKTAQTEAPGVWEALQEKGRPAREKLVQSLREETREETEAATATQTKSDPTPPEEGDSGETSQPKSDDFPPMPPPPIKPAPRPFGFGRLGGVSAEDEIKALEDRVKTLEREVVRPADNSYVANGPALSDDVVTDASPTPAETGTALVDFTPEDSAGDALADSPYAISDAEERATVPSQTGEPIAVGEGESSPETVAAFVDGAESAESTEGEASLSPAKGKRSKKTTSEASAGSDPGDTAAMTVEELES